MELTVPVLSSCSLFIVEYKLKQVTCDLIKEIHKVCFGLPQASAFQRAAYDP